MQQQPDRQHDSDKAHAQPDQLAIEAAWPQMVRRHHLSPRTPAPITASHAAARNSAIVSGLTGLSGLASVAVAGLQTPNPAIRVHKPV
jgi:hypothetical protein